MQQISDILTDLVCAVVEPMRYELVGVELVPADRHGRLLRVYIDKSSGVLMEDCTAVSRQLSAMLDVEDPIEGDYTLEVSSPGLDRPLFNVEHFQRFEGEMVKIKLLKALTGRRTYKGFIRGVEDANVLIEVDGELFHLPIDQIDSARLVPQF